MSKSQHTAFAPSAATEEGSTPFNPALQDALAPFRAAGFGVHDDLVQGVPDTPATSAVSEDAAGDEGGGTEQVATITASGDAVATSNAATGVATPPEASAAPKAHEGKKSGPKPDKRGPMHSAARALVAAAAPATPKPGSQKQEATGNGEEEVSAEMPVTLLLDPRTAPAKLVSLTQAVYAARKTPFFRFFVGPKKDRSVLTMNIATTPGDSLLLTVVGGHGWLVEEFPMGTSLTLEEVRGDARVVKDAKRAQMIANFRGALNMVLVGRANYLEHQLEVYHARNQGE